MGLANRLPGPKGDSQAAGALDPRDEESAEIIDLASRNAFPAVTDRRSKSDGLGVAAGFALVAGLGALAFWASSAAQNDQAGLDQNASNADQTSASQIPPAPPVSASLVPVPQRPAPVPAAVPASVPGSNTAPASNPYAGPISVYDASAAPSADLAPPAASAEAVANAQGGAGLTGSAAAFAASIGGVGGAPAQATQMTNPSTTVTKGTLIPAVLETAINTDVPGYVRAVVSDDVKSFDGTKVLIPRSSRLIGQYQSGVQQGQKRAYVIWEEVITPEGVVVRLASPAVSFDGTTGLEGKVDSHFFKRFGSAMLLSVIGGLGASISGGTSVILGGAQTAIPDADISPTIRVAMGEPVRVFTARNLDFSTVPN